MHAWWKKIRGFYDLDKEKYFYRNEASNFYRWAFFQGVPPLIMSLSVFINVIDMLGSEEQVAKWSKPTTELNILGCYAQTELGHGSNVAGLETTATFDKATDSFIINSPTLTSTKYWPGGMGRWANYATVFANLVLDGNPIGV